MKILTLQITIEKMVSESCPELKYSIGGTVSEQGHYFGFASPLTKEEFNQENLNKIIERNCQPIVWGCDEQEIRIISKIVADCRVKETRLSLWC